MNEFVNPKSMATPGAIGAMVMVIANTICLQFPEITFRWTTIGLSFLAGLIVFSAKEIGLCQRAAFWIFNSLIIFSVGIGTSNIGARIEQTSVASASPRAPPVANAGWLDMLVAPAQASPAAPPSRRQADRQDSAATARPDTDRRQAQARERTDAPARQSNREESGVAASASSAGSDEIELLDQKIEQAEGERVQAQAAAGKAQAEAERARAERQRIEVLERDRKEREKARFFKRW